MRIGVVADTHLLAAPTAGPGHPCRPRLTVAGQALPTALLAALSGVDLILHAGDVMTAEALTAFESIGPPLLAVHGNVDCAELRERLPVERVVEVGGAAIAMVHDAGAARGRLQRLRRRFPDADAVVFGHSHLPLHEQADGFQIFNPGSPTERRRAPTRTMGLARAQAGRVRFELVDLG